MKLPDLTIVPGAVTVAVTSGKGGVGKTTTATALATALTERGVDVIVVDADISGPNVHLVTGLTDATLGVDKENVKLRLPVTPLGFRVVTQKSVAGDKRINDLQVVDLKHIAQLADPTQVVIVDLPPGWTDEHTAVAQTLPDLVLTVVAPTVPALADHKKHVAAWKTTWTAVIKGVKDSDKRRKVVLPDSPNVVTVETMARFTGYAEASGDLVTIRRVDAVHADVVAKHANPVTSLPAAESVAAAAQTPEMQVLADLVTNLLPAQQDEAS